MKQMWINEKFHILKQFHSLALVYHAFGVSTQDVQYRSPWCMDVGVNPTWLSLSFLPSKQCQRGELTPSALLPCLWMRRFEKEMMNWSPSSGPWCFTDNRLAPCQLRAGAADMRESQGSLLWQKCNFHSTVALEQSVLVMWPPVLALLLHLWLYVHIREKKKCSQKKEKIYI